jgi:hypothetical protein
MTLEIEKAPREEPMEKHEEERLKWRVEQTYWGVCIILVMLVFVLYKLY